MNARDKSFCLSSYRPDAGSAGLGRGTQIADIDVVTARGELAPILHGPQCDVSEAGCVPSRAPDNRRLCSSGRLLAMLPGA